MFYNFKAFDQEREMYNRLPYESVIQGEMMKKKQTESKKQAQEQQNHNTFNSVTQKVTPENQNQTHNSKKEGIYPINQKR